MRISGREDLRLRLASIDGKGYKAYQDIEGAYDFGFFTLYVDHAQSDPFAPPSRLRARVSQRVAGFPAELWANRARRLGLEDYLTRAFAEISRRSAGNRQGTGHSGMVSIQHCGQEVLERTSVRVTEDMVEARFVVGLPAAGRRILGRAAISILCDLVPRLVEASLLYRNLPAEQVRKHVENVEDAEFVRSQLPKLGLVAFIGDGSILPRESGASDRPLRQGRVISFRAPEEYKVSLKLPNRGEVTGMGIPAGVTLIVGGGYHGKSTLLRAIERGVYNHIPGDGRELAITVGDAVKIRAEDGRSVSGVDISSFINNLPFGQGTENFSTPNASGSTSQAANIIEALEAGAKLLLLDEDTSATNFMLRDSRMQRLVPKDNEPITPFIDRVRELYHNFGVSSILVIGGAGDYLDVADRVLMMQNFLPYDVTDRAREVAKLEPTGRQLEPNQPMSVRSRIPLPASFGLDSRHKVKAKGTDVVLWGHEELDLSNLEQLVDPAQANAIAAMIRYAVDRHYIDGSRTLSQVLDALLKDCRDHGLEIISPFRGQHPGEYAMPRRFEIAAAINRFRRLQVRQA